MSTNPYARAAERPAAPIASAEEQQVADYELAVGPNHHYYVPKFEEYDKGGSLMSWHWPAFFATSPWFLFRKMWAVGIVNLFYPWVAAILFFIVSAVLVLPLPVIILAASC